MAYLGSWKIDDNLTFPANTHTPATGAATDADAVPAYRVYEDETGTAILTGNMAKLDDANTTGFYSEQVALSAANGFEKGKCYTIYISAAVGAVTGTAAHTFQIEAEVDANTVSPNVVIGSIAAGAITAAAIATDAIDADALADAAITAATFAAGAITATVIATDAIDNDAIAANAVTEIQSGLATASALTTVSTNVDSILLDTGTDGVVVASGSKTGYSLAAGQIVVKKNTALAAFMFPMFDADDGTPATGLTVTATRSIDGGAFAACANSVTEVSNGWYKIDLAAADLNGTVIAFKLTATGAASNNFSIVTQA